MFKSLFNKTQQRELDEFLENLRGMDKLEIAGPLCLAIDYRNAVLADSGLDLLEPHLAMAAKPSLQWTVNRDIKAAQKGGENGRVLAAGLMMWLHTLRAVRNPRLRAKAREMWGELGRAFDSISDGAILVETVTGFSPNLSGCGRFPDGFDPQPE